MQAINRVSKLIPPLILVALLIIGYFLFSWPTTPVSANDKENTAIVRSIAVLPFVNTGTDTSQDYLFDGLSDGILNSLAKLKGVKVCARSSSFQFRGNDIDSKEIGRQLGVNTVLKSSGEFTEDRILINTQLVNTEDGSAVWSQRYDEKKEDVFSLQNKIAQSVSEKMNLPFGAKEQFIDIDKKATTSKEAYGLYLKGRAAWMIKTPKELKKGIDLFQKSIEFDPSYAAAYSGIADCYTALGYGSFLAPKEAFPKAFEAAQKALKLDSTLAEPHASLGFYKFYYSWDWAAAEQEFRQSIALNPNYSLAYDWYGYYLTAMQRYDEAMVMFKKAQSLDPLSSLVNTDIGFSAYYSGDYDFAIKQLQQTLQQNSKFMLAHLWLGRSYQAKKMYADAIAAYKNASALSSGWPVALAAIGSVYGVSGNKIEAKLILDSLTNAAPTKFVTSYGMALVYAGIGETDQAFFWLNKAFDERSNWLVWLKTDPRWNVIRSDKRFIELVNKVGLPN